MPKWRGSNGARARANPASRTSRVTEATRDSVPRRVGVGWQACPVPGAAALGYAT